MDSRPQKARRNNHVCTTSPKGDQRKGKIVYTPTARSTSASMPIGSALNKLWRVFAANESDDNKEPGARGDFTVRARHTMTGPSSMLMTSMLPPTIDQVATAQRVMKMTFPNQDEKDDEVLHRYLKLKGQYSLCRTWTASFFSPFTCGEFTFDKPMSNLGQCLVCSSSRSSRRSSSSSSSSSSRISSCCFCCSSSSSSSSSISTSSSNRS